MITPTPRTSSEINPQAGQRSAVVPARSSVNTPPQQWAVGQLLKATLVQQLSQNTFILSIGKQQVTASFKHGDQVSNLANQQRLPLGAEVALRVVKTGSQPIMQFVEPSMAQRQAALSAEGLRQALPKQEPLQQFFGRLPLALQTQNAEARLPPAIQQAVQQLQNQIVSRQAIQHPEQLKRAIQESGAFLETHLQHATTSSNSGDVAARDLKAQLLRLASLLQQQAANTLSPQTSRTDPNSPPVQYPIKPIHAQTGQAQNGQAQSAQTTSQQTPLSDSLRSEQRAVLTEARLSGEAKAALQNQTAQHLARAMSLDLPTLQRHVESALARIQFNQLQSLGALEHSPHGVLLELPVKDQQQIDVFQFHIDDQAEHGEQSDNNKLWSVMLSFEMEGLGNMHARLILGGEQIRASVWAESADTYTLVENHLDALRDRLREVAFLDPQVRCFKGQPESIAQPQEHTDELIDIEI